MDTRSPNVTRALRMTTRCDCTGCELRRHSSPIWMIPSFSTCRAPAMTVPRPIVSIESLRSPARSRPTMPRKPPGGTAITALLIARAALDRRLAPGVEAAQRRERAREHQLIRGPDGYVHLGQSGAQSRAHGLPGIDVDHGVQSRAAAREVRAETPYRPHPAAPRQYRRRQHRSTAHLPGGTPADCAVCPRAWPAPREYRERLRR